MIDDKVPEFDKHAGGLTIYQYLQLLRGEGIKVVYLPHDRFPRQPYTRILQQQGIEVLFGRIDVDEWLAENGNRMAWALLARPEVAPHYIESIRRHSRAQILYYPHDLHFLRERRRFEVMRDDGARLASERLEKVERDIFRTVDCVLTPSADEVASVRALANDAAVHVIPAYVYPEDEPPDTQLTRPKGPVAIFVGGFGHSPNVDAAHVLVEVIMRLVWKIVPDARLLIVGSNPTSDVLGLANDQVTVVGYVPHLAPYFAQARVSVNPLRFGAGVKGKIVASLHAGVPVVTTSVGNEGLRLTDGVEALIGDTEDEIASLVTKVLSDDTLADSLSTAGRRYVSREFGEGMARQALMAALRPAAQSPL